MQDFFLFYLDLELFAKIKNTWFLHTCFIHFYYNSRFKQNKENREYDFVDIIKKKTCAKFQQRILNSMVVGARQRFHFFTQKTWFLRNNRGLS